MGVQFTDTLRSRHHDVDDPRDPGGHDTATNSLRTERAAKYGVDCPDAVEFRAWEPGGEYERGLLLKNVSTQIVRIKYRLPETKYFALPFPPSSSVPLSPGCSTLLPVTFRPVRREAYEDSVVIVVAAAGEFRVRVIATLPAVRLLTPESLDFGYCPANTLTVKTFLLRNIGDLPLRCRWSALPPFRVGGLGQRKQPAQHKEQQEEAMVLARGQSSEIRVGFEPTEAAVYIGKAVCEIDGAAPHSIDLRGVGKYAFLSMNPDILDFGEVYAGTTAEHQVVLRNATLVDASFTLSPSGPLPYDKSFTLSPSRGLVPPRGSLALRVTYAPSAAGAWSSEAFSLIVAGSATNAVNAGAGGKVMRCSGSALGPSIRFGGESITFGDVKRGEMASRVLHLYNSFQVPAVFQFAADPCGTFAFSRTAGVVPPRSASHVTITFQPAYAACYHRRLTCLVKDGAPVAVDVVGTCWDDMRRPPSLAQRHVEAQRHRQSQGIFAPPSSADPEHQSNLRLRALASIDEPLATNATQLVTNNTHHNNTHSNNNSSSDIADTLTLASPRYSESSAAQDPTLELWAALFAEAASNGNPIAISLSDVDFGASSHSRGADTRIVYVTNNTNAKVTVFWRVPASHSDKQAQSAFQVAPEEADVRPGASVSFKLVFIPERDNRYYWAELECVAYVKTMRNFRLVSENSICPPWILPVKVQGHTYTPTSEEFMPKASFEPTGRAIVFAPCQVGAHSYQTAALANHGDTPVKFDFLPVEGGRLRVVPERGVVPPQTTTVVALQYNALDNAPFQGKLRCVLNHSHANAMEVPVRACGFSPSVRLLGDSESLLYFKPTCVGARSERTLTMQNASRIPVAFDWVISRTMEDLISINPPSGIIRGNEAKQVLFSLSPQESRRYSLRVPCAVATADANNNAAGAKEHNKNNMRLHLSVLGEGTSGRVDINPARVDFGPVVVDTEAKRTVTVVNRSDGNLYYTIACSLEPIEDEEYGTSGSLLMDAAAECLTITPSCGSLAGRATQTVTLRFKPTRRGAYNFRLSCTVGGAPGSAELTTVNGQRDSTTLSLSAALPPSRLEPHSSSIVTTTAQVLASGQHPTFTITDCRSNRGLGKARLWRQLLLHELNQNLAADLTDAELQMRRSTKLISTAAALSRLSPHALTLGASASGSVPSTVYVEVTNHGSVDVSWRFNCTGEREVDLESWVEEADVGRSAEEKAQAAILEEGVLAVHPRVGTLKVGETTTITFTYLHKDVGDHHLAVLLDINKGKRIHIDLRGHTLAENDRHWLISGSSSADLEETLGPVPIGDPDPPFQAIELFNAGLSAIEYTVDTSDMQRTNESNYGFDIFKCIDPVGVIQPGEEALLNICFQPLEAKEYSVALPIKVGGLDARTVTVRASGFDARYVDGVPRMHASTQRPYHEVSGLGNKQTLVPPSQPATLSYDLMCLGDVPVSSITRRIVVVKNVSNLPVNYKWNPSMFKTGIIRGTLSIEPLSGRLLPGAHAVVKLVYTASGQPQSWEACITCSVDVEEVPDSLINHNSNDTRSFSSFLPEPSEEVILTDKRETAPVRSRSRHTSVVSAMTQATVGRLPRLSQVVSQRTFYDMQRENARQQPYKPWTLSLTMQANVMSAKRYADKHPTDTISTFVPLPACIPSPASDDETVQPISEGEADVCASVITQLVLEVVSEPEMDHLLRNGLDEETAPVYVPAVDLYATVAHSTHKKQHQQQHQEKLLERQSSVRSVSSMNATGASHASSNGLEPSEMLSNVMQVDGMLMHTAEFEELAELVIEGTLFSLVTDTHGASHMKASLYDDS